MSKVKKNIAQFEDNLREIWRYVYSPRRSLNPIISIDCFFCLKLKISENADLNGYYFSGKLYKCLNVVLGYFTDLIRHILEALGEEINYTEK